MDTKLKAIVWFLIIALIVDVVGFVSLSQINKIAEPLNNDIPKGLKEIGETSHLNGLAQFIRYYDEVLTQSARNYAFTQDKKWERRYRKVEPELDRIIKEVIEKGDAVDAGFFSSVDEANLALVGMEYESIDLVDKGQVEEAVKILESDEYWGQKDIYERGLRDYVARKGASYNEALLAETSTLESATQKTKDLIDFNKQILWVFVIVFIIAATIVAFVVSKILYDQLKIKKQKASR